MVDYFKRFLIVAVIAIFISLLFLTTMTTYASENGNSSLTQSYIWPIEGGDITDTFGTRQGQHYGIDIAAPQGTNVVSIASGEVSRSYYSGSYGNVIFIRHDNGLESVYAHLHQRHVEEGSRVAEGEEIGTVGSTGRSSGNHLHFEVHEGEWNVDKTNAVDPLLVLNTSDLSLPLYAAAEEVIEVTTEELVEEVVSNKYEEVVAETEVLNEEYQSVLSSRLPLVSYRVDEAEFHATWSDDVMYKEINTITEMELMPEEKEQKPHLEVTIASGDTLWGIANEHRVTVSDLKKWNQLTDHLLSIGQTLLIYPYDEDVIHMVQQGDTLNQIALTYNTTVEDIKQFNALEKDIIFPGDILQIKE